MPTEYSSTFDPFWQEHFAKQISVRMPIVQILASVSFMNLQLTEGAVDLSVCAQMPNLRDLIAPTAPVAVSGKESLRSIPRLRELVLTDGAFSARDLAMISESPTLVKLHLNGMRISPDELAVLNAAPKLKELTLHRVSGITASDIAALTSITQLRLSEFDAGDTSALAEMPRIRKIELQKVPLQNLGVLAAPNLVSFTSDARASDEAGLSILQTKTRLATFAYPVADLSVLTSCTKLVSVRVDGSGPADLDIIRHLPISHLEIFFAPDEQRVNDILEHARAVWPQLRSTGYRRDWDKRKTVPLIASQDPGSTNLSNSVAPDAPSHESRYRAWFIGRLLRSRQG